MQQTDDNGDVIHIDPPAHPRNKVHGGGYDPPTEDLGPEGGNTDEKGGWVTERGYGMPILASDEVQKHPDAEWRQPAVSPELERRHDGDDLFMGIQNSEKEERVNQDILRPQKVSLGRKL